MSVQARRGWRAARVYLFSDLYGELESASDGWFTGASQEFSRARQPTYQRLLAKHRWKSGDALMADALRDAGSPSVKKSYASYVLAALLAHRRVDLLITCNTHDPHDSCVPCARAVSGITAKIARDRAEARLPVVSGWGK